MKLYTEICSKKRKIEERFKFLTYRLEDLFSFDFKLTIRFKWTGGESFSSTVILKEQFQVMFLKNGEKVRKRRV